MKKQQFFDDVKTHLLKQMKKSINSDQQCQYTGPNGLRCAIGGLLPKSVETKNFESRAASALGGFQEVKKALAGYKINWESPRQPISNDCLFMDGLQYVHDTYEPDQWEEKLALFAKNKNLQMEGITT